MLSTLKIQFLFFKNEFREGTYPLCCGRKSSPWGCCLKARLSKCWRNIYFLCVKEWQGEKKMKRVKGLNRVTNIMSLAAVLLFAAGIASAESESKGTWDKAGKELQEAAAAVGDATKESTAQAWQKTKETSEDVAESTVEVSKKAWEKTKEVTGEVAEGSQKAWEATAEKSQEVVEEVKQKLHNTTAPAAENSQPAD
jgi:gas vesicle protein